MTNFTARIVGDVAEDDGAEVRRRFDIEATLHGRSHHFSVPASQFANMGWPVELLGARAIIFPSFGLKEHARTAVQLLSRRYPSAPRLHPHRLAQGRTMAGSSSMPVGRLDGSEDNSQSTLHLARYVLPTPLTGNVLNEAIRASLALLDLAPDQVTAPCLSAIYRAVLGSIDFTLHLAGPTGTGKTELAALAQQHFGPAMDSRHLPASWLSTGNALEGLAFQAKDVLLVVDDFAPAGTSSDVQRYHKEATVSSVVRATRQGGAGCGPMGACAPRSRRAA